MDAGHERQGHCSNPEVGPCMPIDEGRDSLKKGVE